MVSLQAPSPTQTKPISCCIAAILLLLTARICRRINHDQSRTWPWSQAQSEEKLLRMTHRALEPWHQLIDPVMGVKYGSFSGLPQRVIACSFSDQRGRCQNYKTAFKWLPGNVHSALCIEGAGLRSKALPQRPEECYDVTGGLRCFQTSKWEPRSSGFDKLHSGGVLSREDMSISFLRNTDPHEVLCVF